MEQTPSKPVPSIFIETNLKRRPMFLSLPLTLVAKIVGTSHAPSHDITFDDPICHANDVPQAKRCPIDNGEYAFHVLVR